MNHKVVISSLNDLGRAVSEFMSLTSDSVVIAFYGAMGAGKTTFIKELCAQIGVGDVVNSPTFTIVNEYVTSEGESVFHFDFYRIKNSNEALDIGFEEYLYSGNLCLIEWPENVEELLPDDTLRVKIEALESGERVLSF